VREITSEVVGMKMIGYTDKKPKFGLKKIKLSRMKGGEVHESGSSVIFVITQT